VVAWFVGFYCRYYSVSAMAKKISKKKQEGLIIQIMQEDQQDGIYCPECPNVKKECICKK
jgi:hypothetical protein